MSGSIKYACALFAMAVLTFVAQSSAAPSPIISHTTEKIPLLEQIVNYRPALTTTVYARDGSVIGHFSRENRFYTPIESMPPTLVKAFLASEDAAFYLHDGIDLSAVMRAFSKNIEAGDIVQGGSTITQQLVKRLLLTPEKSYVRKIKEAFLSYRLEQLLGKERILEIYLNDIYLGSGAYGVEAAARTYFAKSARDLELAECAVLAGLPKAPSGLNPFHSPESAKNRQRYVLKRMLDQRWITEEAYREALNAPLVYKSEPDPSWKLGAYYLDEVRRRCIDYLSADNLKADSRFDLERFGEAALFESGLHVYTAMDPTHQQAAELSLARGLEASDRRRGDAASVPEVQGALVSMDPRSGDVLALVGGYDYSLSQFNRATMALRQPGSVFKPVVYSAALENGYTAASIVEDSPWSIVDPDTNQIWEPKNFSGSFSGPILLRDALVDSKNVVTARIAVDIGMKNIVRQAEKLGFRRELPLYPSVSLGAAAVTPLEMCNVYATFARAGTHIQPRLILSIRDGNGNEIFKNDSKATPAISPEKAYIITAMLEDAVRGGTGRPAAVLDRPIAGKTGTTNETRDAWFIGYTPYLVTAVYVGFDDNKSMGPGEVGSVAACPIWVDYRRAVEKDYPITNFEVPEGIVFERVSRGEDTAGPDVLLPFIKGTEPSRAQNKEKEGTGDR